MQRSNRSSRSVFWIHTLSRERKFDDPELLLKHLGVTSAAEIDLPAIARYQNVEIRYSELAGCDAQILGVGDRAVATISLTASAGRQRFSIAHELGHWNRHRGKSLSCTVNADAGERGSSYEREADRFAAALLMPKFLFVPRARALKKTTIANAEILAHEFSASLTSALIRFVETGPEPATLVCSGAGGRRLWFARHSDVTLFPNDELDASSQALTVLYGQHKRSARRTVAGRMWFNSLRGRDASIYEESIRVVDGEVLTLLVHTATKV